MKTKFEKGERGQLLLLSDLKKEGAKWGKRTLKKAPFSYNNTWQIAWYEPGAWSTPHCHEGSESVYYFGFKGDRGNAKIYLGWPLSEAQIIEITEPALCYMPAYEVHCFSNAGDSEMLLIHTFSPPWDEYLNVELDLFDAETKKTYNDINEYAEHVRVDDEKHATLGYIEHLKKIGKY